MNVLILNYEYPPLGGGAANATQCLLREFSRVPDLHIDLVTSSTGTTRAEQFSENITIHFLDIGKNENMHYQSSRDLLTYSWKARRYAKRLIQQNPYDLCHAFFGIPCGFIARNLRLPYIVSLRGSDVPFYNVRFKQMDHLLFKRMSIGIWENAHAVIANSEGLRKIALQSAPAQPISIICNGIDTKTFSPAPHQRNGLKIICVARLIARKGIAHLIRAIAEVGKKNVHLTLAGQGNQEAELRGLTRDLGVEKKVRFAGLIDHDRIADEYQQHDLFVLPSLNEGMSNTALEAMACGLPIVMTEVGGTSELLEDGENGFVIKKESSADIARIIRKYIADENMLTRHGENSRRRAESLGWATAAQGYLEHYRACVTCADKG